MKICLNCQKELSSHLKKFCSHQCQQDFYYKVSIQEWKKGNVHFGYRRLKRYLIDTYGYKCSVCGISEWNGESLILEIEHKDGNSDNDNEENVCLICPNCHSQTDTYKAKNKGNGRYKRKQRYQSGKSY